MLYFSFTDQTMLELESKKVERLQVEDTLMILKDENPMKE